MNDVLERLAALHTDPGPTTDAAVAADLRRGRRALARRRAVRGTGVGIVAAAALGIAGAGLGRTPTAHAGLHLVEYGGRQLPGFTVAKVPEGFVLQGVAPGSLDISRPGDHSSLDDFVGKIVITVEDAAPVPQTPGGQVRITRHRNVVELRCPDGSVHKMRLTAAREPLAAAGCSQVPTSPTVNAPETSGRDIDVDGARGRITTNSEGTTYFRYTVADRTVTIQVWPTIRLSDSQVREFADGVTVSAGAQLSHG